MEIKFGDRVRVSERCPLSALRGQEGVVVGEYPHPNREMFPDPMIEVKVRITDYSGPFRFYPWELEPATPTDKESATA